MSYDKNTLEKIINDSYCDLLNEEPFILMKKNDLGEKVISTKLGSYIQKYIQDFHVNCEYNRMTDEHGNQITKKINLDPNVDDLSSVYPDIIIHRQEDGNHNLLIIEIKMLWKNKGKKKDIIKIQNYLPQLNYKYGLYLELDETNIAEMKWFLNDSIHL